MKEIEDEEGSVWNWDLAWGRSLLVADSVEQPEKVPRQGSPTFGLTMTEINRGEVPLLEREPPRVGPHLLFSVRFSRREDAHRLRLRSTYLPVFSAEQVRAGKKAGMLSTLARSLVRFAHGWYSTRDLSDQEKLRVLARMLPEETVVAGETAAMIYGIEVRQPASYRSAFRVCVARPEGRRALRRPGIRCRVLRFEPGDVIRFWGVPCTSPLRTLIDMAAAETIEIATRLMECFLQRGFFSRRQLERRIDSMRGRRGVQTLRRAFDLADTRSESVFETAVRLRLREAGLPHFEPQVRVWVPGKENPYRLDLGHRNSLKGTHLAVECDSEKYHPLTGPKAEADQSRRQEIMRAGWTVLSIRFSELKGPLRTFEAAVAKHLRVSLATLERHPWRLSRWSRLHNAWVREGEPARR